MRAHKNVPAKRMGRRAVEVDIFETAHRFAVALHSVGAMDGAGLREMDQLCLPQPARTTPDTRPGCKPSVILQR